MRLRLLLTIPIFVVCPTPALRAQSHPDCPAHPATLAAMRGCYRPLLVFSSTAQQNPFSHQQAALDAAADDLMDRNVLLVPVLASAKGYKPPLDAPSVLLPPTELATIRRRFHAAPGAFRVVLLGEDGSPKLSRNMPVPVESLNALIDTMPTRKCEMQQPHSN